MSETDILIIDGDVGYTAKLCEDLARHGVSAVCCNSLARAMGMLHTGNYRVVLLGDDLPDKGIDALAAIREIPSFPEVILVSRNRDPDVAERCIREGAWDYLLKPPNIQRLFVLVDRIGDYWRKRSSTRPPVALRRGGIVGSSRMLQLALDNVAVAAANESNVMLIGETGTGKELFARAVHENSPRRKKSFVVVDCAALPDTLAESLLFGHERGAFTSADSQTIGLIRQADGGTLFLDEVGELPLPIQRVFLRVLESRTFRPVGATTEVMSDFRLVSATNRDLEAMVESGDFRRDLFYRLHGSHIQLPSLREISEDINEMTCHFIRRHCQRLNLENKGFSPDFLAALLDYDWPGNIREMINTVEQAIAQAGSESILYPRHLPRRLRSRVVRRTLGGEPAPAESKHQDFCHDASPLPSLKSYRAIQTALIEQDYLNRLMDQTGGDIRRACEVSGLSRARLYSLIKQHGIERG
ncbi:response regulator [Pseudodesulfovibrio sp. F-1]|uniref:Response regulator n=1 Tax=Pseudodesulfovibrio alkaliphilus TaxID=2661613 RepID=A0A7K1KIW6_9BACT|nr:sigma-54 dependent transcriptional regulator [Pseudodesulfovibrio alkaliphilus]MUM76023.1 response regulator [Pseudodesulfovibrio alkaliphilus]